MVVFGSAIVARLSQDLTGFALAIAGFGAEPSQGCGGAPAT
jgi:hypothetical protein